jgi:hypothetical protein
MADHDPFWAHSTGSVRKPFWVHGVMLFLHWELRRFLSRCGYIPEMKKLAPNWTLLTFLKFFTLPRMGNICIGKSPATNVFD